MLETALIGGSIGSSLLNTAMQFKNLKYQKKLQRKMFAREDTAIQRRVADLRAAGLSPVLAAGQGADAGPTVATQPPQTDLANDVMNMITMQENIQNSISQRELARAQQSQAEAGAYKLKQEGRYAKHEADWFEDKPFIKGMSMTGKMASEVQSFLEWMADKLNKGKKPQVEEPKINPGRPGYGKTQVSPRG